MSELMTERGWINEWALELTEEEIREMVIDFVRARRTYRSLCYLFSNDPANYSRMWEACEKATGKGPFGWYVPEGSDDLSPSKPFIEFATRYLLDEQRRIRKG